MNRTLTLGKDYKIDNYGSEHIGFFVLDEDEDTTYPYIFIERKTYKVIDAYATEQDAISSIVDVKIEFTKAIINHPHLLKRAVIIVDGNSNSCDISLEAIDDDGDLFGTLAPIKCSANEMVQIHKLCDIFEVEMDWRK